MKTLRKMDYESNVKRIVKAIMKEGTNEYGMCIIYMSDALVEDVMKMPVKKGKENYQYDINGLLRKKGKKDDDGLKWYYSVKSIDWSKYAVEEEGHNCLIFYLEEEYTSY